jgi:hypothetical protein
MPRSAAQVMQLALPDASHRKAVLQLLLRSSSLAANIAPSAWAVHLFDWGFRLHVGQVEALTLFEDRIWLLLAAHPEDARLAGLPVVAINFKCQRGPQSVFVGSAPQLMDARDVLEPLHTAFVEVAARTNGGIPRKGTPFMRFHSREIIEYAASEDHAPLSEAAHIRCVRAP